MSEDLNVTREGELWGRVVHRSLKVERCRNGYLVSYKRVADQPDEFHKTTEERRVFITNSDMLEFVEEYFQGEPRP